MEDTFQACQYIVSGWYAYLGGDIQVIQDKIIDNYELLQILNTPYHKIEYQEWPQQKFI